MFFNVQARQGFLSQRLAFVHVLKLVLVMVIANQGKSQAASTDVSSETQGFNGEGGGKETR